MADPTVYIAHGRIRANDHIFLDGQEVPASDLTPEDIKHLRRLGVLKTRAEALPAAVVEESLSAKDEEIARLREQLALLQEAQKQGTPGAEAAAASTESALSEAESAAKSSSKK